MVVNYLCCNSGLLFVGNALFEVAYELGLCFFYPRNAA